MAWFQPVRGGQGERQLLADVPAGLVDDRKSVGVRVLREADGRSQGRDDRRELAEVGLGGLRRVVVPAVGRGAEDGRLATEGPEQRLAQPAARAVAGVEGDDEPLASDRLDVHRRQDQRPGGLPSGLSTERI